MALFAAFNPTSRVYRLCNLVRSKVFSSTPDSIGDHRQRQSTTTILVGRTRVLKVGFGDVLLSEWNQTIVLSLLQNSAAGRLPGMATKGTKTQFVTFVLFVVDSIFHQVAPEIEIGRTSALPARRPGPLRILQRALFRLRRDQEGNSTSRFSATIRLMLRTQARSRG